MTAVSDKTARDAGAHITTLTLRHFITSTRTDRGSGTAGWPHELIPNATADKQRAWLTGAWNETGPALAAALPPGSFLIPNGNSQATPPPGFNALSIEFFTPSAGSVAQLESLAGRLVEVHAYIGANETLFALTLATYLLGVQEAQYFGAGNTWSTCDSWLDAAQRADYARPLGAPLAPAATAGARISRAFASGTTAELAVNAAGEGVASCIRWSDGAVTETPGGCAALRARVWG